MTSAINLLQPDFYQRLFDPDYVALPPGAKEDVFYPTSDDEFEDMVREWEEADASLQEKNFYDTEA